jgi:dipeptidyl aminopeptidase/acylaminoacyl peptidase
MTLRPRTGTAVMTVVLAAFGAGLTHAQPAPAPAEVPPDKTPWTVDDILLAESAGAFDLSPDGKRVVWVKSQMDKEKDGRVSNLFLTNLETKTETQLTRGQQSHSQPLWSPDGEWIAFASSRPLPKKDENVAERQLWLISTHGGEPYPVTELKRAVQDYQWVDGGTIVFSAQEDPSFYEQELKTKKDGSRVVDDVEHEPPVRLFKLAIKDKKITRLTGNTDFIEAFAVSPDGTKAATVHQQSLSFQWDHKTLPKTFVYDLTTGQRTEVFAGARIPPRELRWARDGAGFYAVAPYSSDPRFFTASIAVVYFYDLARASHSRVDLGWENGLASGLAMTQDGFVTLLANGAWNKPARFVREGGAWRRIDIEGEHARNIHALTVTKDGRTMVYEYSTASTPDQVFRGTLDGGRITDTAQLTQLNPGFKARTPARTEVIRWKGALDEEVEGILFYPRGYEAGKRYPLVTMPHGGPAGADLDQWDETWSYATQLIAQRGAFALKPNYHGSSNYGLSGSSRSAAAGTTTSRFRTSRGVSIT